MLPNGKILIWSSWDKDAFTYGTGESSSNPAQQQTQTQIYDPASGAVSGLITVTNTGHDMFCPGTAFLEDGRLLVSGGGGGGVGPFVTNTSIYDFASDQWYGDARMHYERWYNTAVTLADGDVFTLGGRNDALGYNDPGELWSSGQGWAVLPGTPVKPMTDGVGGRSNEHPKLFLAPNGRLFAAGPSPRLRYYDTIGNGHVDADFVYRADDSLAQNNVSVMFDERKILAAGGSKGYDIGSTALATRNSYVIEVGDTIQETIPRKIQSMTRPRTFANGVILPDGQVLVVGGLDKGRNFWDVGAQTVPELFDPVTETWSDMADQVTPRTYHSVALLMPDGRVFSAGGGYCKPVVDCPDSLNHRDGQLYSPPYLFKGARPVISDAPAAVGYNGSFDVKASADTARFTMVRLSATTHGVNTDQRIIKPGSRSDGHGGFLLNGPTSGNLAPPGYYMLFALNASGVPSVAKFVQITRGAAELTNPGNQSSIAGAAVNVAIDARSPAGKTLRYSAVGLPQGIVINTASGVISGRPAVAEARNVVVTVSDGTSEASAGFTWSVNQPAATPTPLPTAAPTPAPSGKPGASPKPTPKASPKVSPKASPAPTDAPAPSGGADLSIRLRGPKQVKGNEAGKIARYVVVVLNKSKVLAQSTSVTVNYASGLGLVTKPTYCAEAGSGRLVCDLGDLRQHRSKRFGIKLRFAPGTATVETSASVACSASPDPDGANNSASRLTLIN
ncbi:galactose oxidase-like domain-containing protein [Methyloterricola oryzae]|uniref:galactose oxidase-like domain-containing protein n=1 Tax=Methyloterricola oryzae TaxID=1495050 RepID=UPI0006992E46|nr:galactose oxidase-like domain-containing protein [Methyloterricola oryzae]